MPNIIYNLNEQIWITQASYQGLTYRSVRDHFAADYPDRPISCIKTIRNIRNIKVYGCVDPTVKKVGQLNRALSEKKRLGIFLAVIDNPSLSLAEISQDLDISSSSVWNVLHDQKFRAYKINCHQQFNDGDPWRRMEFCEQMLAKLHRDPQTDRKFNFHS